MLLSLYIYNYKMMIFSSIHILLENDDILCPLLMSKIVIILPLQELRGFEEKR